VHGGQHLYSGSICPEHPFLDSRKICQFVIVMSASALFTRLPDPPLLYHILRLNMDAKIAGSISPEFSCIMVYTKLGASGLGPSFFGVHATTLGFHPGLIFVLSPSSRETALGITKVKFKGRKLENGESVGP